MIDIFVRVSVGLPKILKKIRGYFHTGASRKQERLRVSYRLWHLWKCHNWKLQKGNVCIFTLMEALTSEWQKKEYEIGCDNQQFWIKEHWSLWNGNGLNIIGIVLQWGKIQQVNYKTLTLHFFLQYVHYPP